jgi:PPOX class probable F420-dependent enzyme
VLDALGLSLVDSIPIGHLGTVDPAGRPHVVPVCFVWRTGCLYSPIDEKRKHAEPASLRRVRNLVANPRVCLTLDRYDSDWSKLAWVQLRGRATLVADEDERRGAIAALRARYPQYAAMRLEDRPMIRIEVERAVAWSAS